MNKTNGEMQLDALMQEINACESWRDWSDDWPRDHGWDDSHWPSDSWDDSHH